MKKILLIVLMLASSVFGATTYIHVTSAGAGSGSGADWANAMPDPNWIAHMTNTVVADTVYYVKEGTYTLSGSFATTRDGTGVGPVKIIGVNAETTHEGANVVLADHAYGTDRPLLACGANGWNCGGDYFQFFNLQITTSNGDGFYLNTGCGLVNCKLTLGGANAAYEGIYLYNNMGFAINCEVTGVGIGIRLYNGSHRVVNCYVHDCSIGVQTGGGDAIESTIIDTCTTGLNIVSTDNNVVKNCTIYNCTTGIAATDGYLNCILNNVISQCTTGAAWDTEQLSNWCDGNLWNNATNATNLTIGLHDLLLDVGTQCMNAPSTGDFTLTYATAKNAGLGITTNEGVSVSLAKPNIGVDQNDISLYTLTSGIVFPAEADVWYGTGAFGPTGSEYTPAMRASDITVTGGAAATLTAPDIGKDIVVDDLTGTLSGSGMSDVWVGSNP